MFDANDLICIDATYFTVIMVDDYDVTVKSNNTGHYWYIHNCGYPGKKNVVVFHRHNGNLPYHSQCKVNTLRQAIKGIKSHDKWQLNARKK